MKVQSYSSVVPVNQEAVTATPTVRIYFNDAKRQAEPKSDPKTNNSDLPPHLKKIIENIERLKEQIRAAKENLVAIKAKQMNTQTKQELIENQQKLIADMQLQLLEMGQGLIKAVKEAGVDDPGLLLSIII